MLKSAKKDDSNLAREIHHHRQFVHPHIARLYEVVVTENLVWMVMEYCSGRSGIGVNTKAVPLMLTEPSQAKNYMTTYSGMASSRSTRSKRHLPSSSELSHTSTSSTASIAI